jgi:iron uptake system EfeUOB component EfeO/EfeM
LPSNLMPKTALPKLAKPNTAPGLRKTLALVVAATAAPLALAGCMASSPAPGASTGSVQVSPAVDADLQDLLDTGTRQYSAYVKDQTNQLVTGTKAFAEAYAAGDAAKARGLYAATRMHWERIEPVAESFADLDPKLDAREADLEPGQEWTGWHRAEKDLFPPAGFAPLTAAERTALATQLVADTEDLAQRTGSVELSTDKISNGAKELLDEVATGKVTGEEEIWSHTDLWDFQANVDGARTAFESLKPALQRRNPALAEALEVKFAALQDGLKKHTKGDGFTYYNELSQSEVQQLAALVDALGEPLAKLTSAVIQ